MNLRRRLRELEARHVGEPRLLVDGWPMPGTSRQFFQLVRLMQHYEEGTDPEVDFPTGLERAQIDFAQITVAHSLEGEAAQLFGLLQALARGPAEGSEADGQTGASGDKGKAEAASAKARRTTRQGAKAEATCRPTARPARRGTANGVRSRDRGSNPRTRRRT